MPTYEYECEACGHRFDHVQPMAAKPLKKCPACGKQTLERLVSGGTGFILKGAGFWKNDSKARKGSGTSSSSTPAAAGAGATGEGAKPAETKTESKPAAGSGATAATGKPTDAKPAAAGGGKKPKDGAK